MVKAVDLAVIGTGVVGSAFLNQLNGLKASSIKYNVIIIARSSKSVISSDYSPIDLSQWSKLTQNAQQSNLPTDELAKFLKNSPNPSILIDNTSDSKIAASYATFLKNGISIATPNKKAFSSDAKSYNELRSALEAEGAGLVYHEATVGAGLPIIGTLNDLIATGDKVEKIEGIFSGTLSYIFNEFSTMGANNIAFSDVVKVAKSLGYTEPDPRDDLNGLDVARKVTILARLSGLEIESPTSFPVQSLIPKPLESVQSAAEFVEKLPEYDSELASLKEKAFEKKKVLRFVGSVDAVNKQAKVGVEEYGFGHPFASLKGSDNVISIKTKRYQNPLIVQGAGAGADVTAAGVLADAIKIAQRIVK